MMETITSLRSCKHLTWPNSTPALPLKKTTLNYRMYKVAKRLIKQHRHGDSKKPPAYTSVRVKSRPQQNTQQTYVTFDARSKLPSAPPEMMNPTTEQSLKWSVDVELSIHTKTPITEKERLLDIVGIWSDEYVGPNYIKNIIAGLYALSIQELEASDDGMFDTIKYQTKFTRRIGFTAEGLTLTGNPLNINWMVKHGSGKSWFQIKFAMTPTITRRSVTKFSDIIKAQGTTFLGLTFKEIMSEIGGIYRVESDDLIFMIKDNTSD